MNLKINNLKIISGIFFLVFMGYGSCQQYLTNYLNFLGYGGFGFYILVCIYIFFMLGNLFYQKFSSHFGIKKVIQTGIVTYILFIFSLYIGNPYIILITSAIVGFGASLIRTGSNVYIVQISSRNSIGKNSGIFNTFYAMGMTLGSYILGYLIYYIQYQYSFLIYSILPLLGLLLSFLLEDIYEIENKEAKYSIKTQKKHFFYSIKKCIRSRLLRRLSILWFTTFFIYGLVISYMPVQIKNLFGIEYVGYLSALFFSFILLFSYIFGKLSDTRGRRISIFICYIIVIFALIVLYLSTNKAMLIAGICLIAIFYTGMNTLIFSLIGDITSKGNAEHITPFFRMIQSLGAISAILCSKIFFSNSIYLLSLGIIIINTVILYYCYTSPMHEIREKIDNNFIN